VNETFSANLAAAEDLAGNAATPSASSNDTVAVDTSAQGLTINSPTTQQNLTSSSELDVTYSYSDTNPDNVIVRLEEDGDTDTITYDINDSQYADDNAQKTLTVDLSEEDSGIIAEGDYFLNVTATDASSGTSTATTTESIIVVDDTKPTFGPLNVEDDTSTTTNFSFDITDDGSNVDPSTIVVNVTQDSTETLSTSDAGVEYDGTTLTVDTENVSSLTLSEGQVVVTYEAADYSGNLNNPETGDGFSINQEAPAIDSVEAEAGEDTLTVSFTEPVAAVDGTISKDEFAYTDVSGDGAASITSVSSADSDGYVSEVTLTLDSLVSESDLGSDEVNVQQDDLEDSNGFNIRSTDAATSVIDDTNAPLTPGLTAGNVTAGNEGTYTVTVSSPTASTTDVTVKNSTGAVFAQQPDVDVSSGSADVQFDLTNIEQGDVTIEANVTDRGVNFVSSDTVTTVEKDNVSATITSVETNVASSSATVTFSEPMSSDTANVTGHYTAENLTVDYVTYVDDQTYVLEFDEPVAPSDIDNSDVTIAAQPEITDVVGTSASTDEVTLSDNIDPAFDYTSTENGTTTVDVQFTEPVYDNNDGGLSAANFTYVNNSGVAHAVTNVTHSAGDQSATVTLNSSLVPADLYSDQLQATFNDSSDNQATDTVLLTERPLFTDVTIENTTDRQVQISFNSSSELNDFSADLDSEDTIVEVENVDTTLGIDNASVEENNGTYTYTVDYTVPRDGNYDLHLTSATTVAGVTWNINGAVDDVDVDYDDPEPVDAELIASNGDATAVVVQFNEPVVAEDPFGGVDAANITIDGQSAAYDFVEYGGSNEIGLEFSGVIATGDAPSIEFGESTLVERYGDSSSAAGTSETVDTHEYHLDSGTNFVSVPAEYGKLDIASSEFSDKTVMTYDDGEWLTYAPDRAADNQDITSMEGGQGYIVMTDADATVDITVRNEEPGSDAQNATPGQQSLEEGWNLVGHWQEGQQSADDAGALDSIGGSSGATSIWAQQPNSGQFSYQTTTTFNPGESYWVFVENGEVYTAADYDGGI